MHVLSRKALLDFARIHTDAGAALDTWFRIAKAASWRSIGEVRRTYPHADFVAPFTVFNLKGNAYRLIAIVDYRYGKIFIKHVLTHADYDKGAWK